MPRIAFIGAGSTVFTRNLIGDVLALPDLAGSATLALMDIDPERLRASEAAARKLGATRVEATLDRRAALDGADYVVTSFQVGGLPATRIDFDVPRRHGLLDAHGDWIPGR
jgi:alpha-galactosidase